MEIDISAILKKELIGKEVYTYSYEHKDNKYIGDIYSTGIIDDVYLYDANGEGMCIFAKLKNGKTIQLEPKFNNKDGYYEG